MGAGLRASVAEELRRLDPMTSRFCSDDDLGYVAQRTAFEPGQTLMLDASYRLAHLPLVAPEHPNVIATKLGTSYRMGKHEAVTSLVLPVPPTTYEGDGYLALQDELRAAPFAPKIAWHILETRRSRLHATLCGALANGERLQGLTAEQRDRLAGLGPLSVELRGLFSGKLNLGRLYLKVYPECRAGRNAIALIQQAMGARLTDPYLVGLFNLVDDLDLDETRQLAQLIDRWWDKPILRYEIDRLWLLSARDDLVLDGEVIETISLT
jgi:hypothetical protein